MPATIMFICRCPASTARMLPARKQAAMQLRAEKMKVIVENEGLEVFHPEYGTNPHVFYKNLYKFTKNFAWGGALINGDCFENADVELKKDGKVIATQKTNFFGDYKFDGLEDGDYVISIDADGKKKDIPITIAGQSLNLDYVELA